MLLYIWANVTTIPKPELRGFPKGIPLESPPFGVTNRRELVAMKFAQKLGVFVRLNIFQ